MSYPPNPNRLSIHVRECWHCLDRLEKAVPLTSPSTARLCATCAPIYRATISDADPTTAEAAWESRRPRRAS